MSEHEKLINEARRWPRAQGVEPSRPPVEVINDLADALAASVESKQNGAKSSQEFCFDEVKLAEVMLSHKMTTYGAHNFSGCAGCGERYVDTGIGIVRWFAQHHAHAVAEWLRGENDE